MVYRGGNETYRETAAQVNTIWFFDATRSIRLIMQRTLLDRMPETSVLEEHDRGKVVPCLLCKTSIRVGGTPAPPVRDTRS